MAKKKNHSGTFKDPKLKAAIKKEIIERISNGTTLQEICREDGKPNWRKIYEWLDDDSTFAADFARARLIGHDAIAEDCIRIADDSGADATIDKKTGQIVVDGEVVARAKLRIYTRLQLLAKWNPKKYGEKLELAGDAENPLKMQVTIVDDVK